MTAAIQGAAFAGLSCHLAKGPLSNMSELRQGAIISMTISGLSTLVNGGDPFKNMLAAGVASVLAEIALPTKPGSSFTTREHAVRSTVTGITVAAMDRHGNFAEKVLNATVGACITTLGQNAGAQVSSVILNAHSESAASRVMMRDMNTSIGASAERKVVQEAGELSVAQNASAHETERPVKKSVNKTDDIVVYSQPELLEVATKEASRLLEKEGIHVSDANIKSVFEKRPALQGSPQSIESKLIKLGRAENGPKDASTAFDKGVEKVLAVTVNTLMSLVGIGEAHAANRDERGLQIYNPELERKVFLSRGLTEELRKNGGVHTASNLESSASGKPLIFRGPNRASERPFNATEPGTLNMFSGVAQASEVSRSADGNTFMPLWSFERNGNSARIQSRQVEKSCELDQDIIAAAVVQGFAAGMLKEAFDSTPSLSGSAIDRPLEEGFIGYAKGFAKATKIQEECEQQKIKDSIMSQPGGPFMIKDIFSPVKFKNNR